MISDHDNSGTVGSKVDTNSICTALFVFFLVGLLGSATDDEHSLK